MDKDRGGKDREKLPLRPLSVERVHFYGDTLVGAVVENGGKHEIFVAIKPICAALGISWESQQRKLASHPVFAEGIQHLIIPSAGGPQATVCLHLDLLPAFLVTVHPNKVRPEAREKLLLYQKEAHRVLRDYFLGPGYAINPARVDLAKLGLEREKIAARLEIARMVNSWKDKEMQARLDAVPLIDRYGKDIAPTYLAALIGSVTGARLPVEKTYSATELAALFSGEFGCRVTPVMVGRAARKAGVHLPEGVRETPYAFATVTKAAGCDKVVRQVVYREAALPRIRTELAGMLEEKRQKERKSKVVALRKDQDAAR